MPRRAFLVSGAFATALATGILLGTFTTGGAIGAEMAQTSRRDVLADYRPRPEDKAVAPDSRTPDSRTDVAMLDTQHVCQGCDARLYRADGGYRDGEVVDAYAEASPPPDAVPDDDDPQPVAYWSADDESDQAPPLPGLTTH